MSDQPLVSVVMIFKDAVTHLEEAARSVLAQRWPSLELLLVDDGGSDGSAALAAALAAGDPERVRVLCHHGRANRGMSAARALGIAHAQGELTAFLDADDRWDPEHLVEQVALLEEHGHADLVCGRAWTWRSHEHPGAVDELSPLAFAPGVVVDPPRLLAATLRNGAVATPTCSLLVRTPRLRECGGPVERFGGMYEDQVLNSLLQLRYRAVMSGSTTAWYRQHARSASAVARRDGSYHPVVANPSRLRFLEWLDGLPELDRAVADPEVRHLVDGALREQRQGRLPHRGGLARTAADAVRRALPAGARTRARGLVQPRGVGRVRWGSLAPVTPLSRQFGYDRGLPVDRWYLEHFLARWAEDVRGRVLEVGDSSYTTRFGGQRVTRADVLNVDDRPGTTFVADLAEGHGLPDGAFDCVVLTQTLHLVFDVHAAARTLHRILAPGGVLLLTVPGISPVSTDEWASTWHWSFTDHAARRLFGEVFGAQHVEVAQAGNVYAATAFLQGLAAEELVPAKLAVVDRQFPVLVTVRAVRPADRSTS